MNNVGNPYVFALLALAACGREAPPPTCSYTFSGAIVSSGEFGCSTLAGNNIMGTPLYFELDAPSYPPGVARLFIQFYLNGSTLQAGTYTASDVGYAEISIALPCSGPSCQVWAVFRNMGRSSQADQGDFTLRITSTGKNESVSTGKIWWGARFTLDASMPPATYSNATGTLSLHLDY